MKVTLTQMAKSLGVSVETVREAKKDLGLISQNLDEDEIVQIMGKISKTVALRELKDDIKSKKSNDFVTKVRRIDKCDESTVLDMLQDSKEQYVRNEELIQRLQYEISQQDVLTRGNPNGQLSPLPQLGMLEKFQKINISLRNQIVALEQELGRNAKPPEDDDPFK